MQIEIAQLKQQINLLEQRLHIQTAAEQHGYFWRDGMKPLLKWLHAKENIEKTGQEIQNWMLSNRIDLTLYTSRYLDRHRKHCLLSLSWMGTVGWSYVILAGV